MASFYSILKFVNNEHSNESIAIGLIVLSGEKTYFRVSPAKIEFAKKLKPSASRLLDLSITQLSKFVFPENSSRPFMELLIPNESKLDLDYLKRLHVYGDGLVHFSKPSFIDLDFNDETFHKYFEMFVGAIEIERPKIKPARLKLSIEKHVKDPLRGRVDIDYTIGRGTLPMQIFSFKFDAIGVNGSVYAMKAIDFNRYADVASIERVIAEYSCLTESINAFADKRKLKSSRFFIASDPYNGSDKNIRSAYDIFTKEQNKFKILKSNEVEEFTELVIKKDAHKFSEVLDFS